MLEVINGNMQKNKKRTIRQNSSLHLLCRQVATELNNQGISLQIALQGIEADVTEHNVKDMFRAVAKAKFGVQSTSDLDNKQMLEVYEEMVRHFGKFGVTVTWPSQETTESYLNSYIL